MTISLMLLTLLSVSLSAVAQITMKAGLSEPIFSDLLRANNYVYFLQAVLVNPLVIAGLGLYFFGALVWLTVLTRADVSLVYPFVSLGFLLTAGLASLILGEQIGVARLAGILFVSVGVFFVARS